jgi:hypothetical protein
MQSLAGQIPWDRPTSWSGTIIFDGQLVGSAKLGLLF